MLDNNEMNFLLKYVHFNRLKLNRALDFLVQKCKNQHFEENKCFDSIFFIDFKYRCLLTCLVDLKKYQLLESCL